MAKQKVKDWLLAGCAAAGACSSPVSVCDSAPVTDSVAVRARRSPSSVASRKYFARMVRVTPLRVSRTATLATFVIGGCAVRDVLAQEKQLAAAGEWGEHGFEHGDGDA